MKIRYLLPTICCLLYLSNSFAQRKFVFLFKNSGEPAILSDSADFIRVVTDPDAGSELFNVKEYNKNGTVRMIGKTSKIDPITLEGQCIQYYPSGKKQEYANYEKGHLVGDCYYYYPNGKFYADKQYIADKIDHVAGYYPAFKILACNDSTGQALVVDGNGHYVGYDDDFKNVLEEGNVKAGLKDGEWKGNNGNKKNYILFAEQYDNGKFLSGQSTDHDNAVVNYTTKNHEPQYKGGMDGFYRDLSREVIYPKIARENNIQGVVFISFVVEQNGSLSGLKVVKNPNDMLSAEVIRAVKQLPKWEPGMQYGRPVTAVFTVPINFTTSR